jgi:SOS-response transcriptional repressor LexA
LEELPGKGEIVAVRLHNDTTTKRFIKHKNQVILTSINTKYAPIVKKPEEIGSLAKVVCKIKKYK